MSLTEKLVGLNKSNIYPFHMPGHKRRMFPVSELKSAYGIDITEIDDFDNLHSACGVIKEAEERAAAVFGARETHFLVNGASSGILAAVYAGVREGDRLYVARNSHKAVYNAAMLSKADVCYIYPDTESFFEICAGISADKVREILQHDRENNLITDRALMVITSPTYEGVVSDVEGIAKVCHEYGVSLVVDEAHGAHFGFSDDFPKSSIALGADVVITSIHKTLPAFTQTALIHIGSSCMFADRVRTMLTVFLTSSPSYVLMAGIEGCTDLLEKDGKDLFARYCDRLDKFYHAVSECKNISVLTADKLTCSGSTGHDKGKIVIQDKSGKMSGKQLYDTLLGTYELQPEMAAGSYIVMMTSVADDDEGFARLEKALLELDEVLQTGEPSEKDRGFWGKLIDRIMGRKIRKVLFSTDELSSDFMNMYDGGTGIYNSTVAAMNIDDAVFEDNVETVPIELAAGRVSGEYVYFYPPGIPIVAPGEIISKPVLDEILNGIQAGFSDKKNIRVICD